MGKPIVVLDANILYSAPLRDILMWLAVEEIYLPRWSNLIHEEWIDAVLRNRPDLNRSQLIRTRDKMNLVIPESLVENFESLIPQFTLPDPNDRHVLAAAVKTEALAIITLNLKDFPANVLNEYGLEALHPDEFICRLMDSNLSAVLTTMNIHRTKLSKPPKTPQEYVLTLEKQGLTQTVGIIRNYQELI